MRITRETLLKIAEETVARCTREQRDVIAAYLCGSVLGEEYLVGGTADLDLVFVHADAVAVEREIQRLSDEVHLDIAHHAIQEYGQARRLRLHPWLGPTIQSCKVLYDPRHFIDFIQASVRGQFDRPDFVLERCRRHVEQARKIWFSLQAQPPGVEAVYSYLRAVGHAANALAGLNGSPITERRFLLLFRERVEALGKPGLYPGIMGLLGAPNLTPGSLAAWLDLWQAAFLSVPREKTPPRLHAERERYYRRAFEAILSSEQPNAVLWPMLRTWTLAATFLPEDSAAFAGWHQACAQLGLLEEAFQSRVEALDAYLDLVDETLEGWGRAHGA